MTLLLKTQRAVPIAQWCWRIALKFGTLTSAARINRGGDKSPAKRHFICSLKFLISKLRLQEFNTMPGMRSKSVVILSRSCFSQGQCGRSMAASWIGVYALLYNLMWSHWGSGLLQKVYGLSLVGPEEVTLDLVLLPFGITDVSVFPVMGIVSLFFFFFKKWKDPGKKW